MHPHVMEAREDTAWKGPLALGSNWLGGPRARPEQPPTEDAWTLWRGWAIILVANSGGAQGKESLQPPPPPPHTHLFWVKTLGWECGQELVHGSIHVVKAQRSARVTQNPGVILCLL